MTVPTSLLPAQPPLPYIKPTFANTHGGKTYTPTHPGLFRVEFGAPQRTASGATSGESEESYSSRLVAVRDFPANEEITLLENLSLAPEKAYSSVQYGAGPRDHLELNSDLLFMNHSCDPSVTLHLIPNQPERWCVTTRENGLIAGDNVTFFYPSTEWDMAQGFDCSCGAQECLGKIAGAKSLRMADLDKRGYVNEHIRTLKKEQASNGA